MIFPQKEVKASDNPTSSSENRIDKPSLSMFHPLLVDPTPEENDPRTISVKMGTASSGNHGHAGRPGYQGGRASGEIISESAFTLGSGSAELDRWRKSIRIKNSALEKSDKQVAILFSKLHAIAPTAGIVLFDKSDEPDIAELIQQGSMLNHSKVMLKEMDNNSCHLNSSRLFQSGKADAIFTGYALDTDGLWRQHTIALKGSTVIETTIARLKYFGIKLVGKEAKAFVKAQEAINKSLNKSIFDSVPKKAWQHLVEGFDDGESKLYLAQFMLTKGARLNGQFLPLVEWKKRVGKVSPLSQVEQSFRSVMNNIFSRQLLSAKKDVERFVKLGGTILDKKTWTKETDEMTLPIRWYPYKSGGDEALGLINFELPEWIESPHVLDAIRKENFIFAREISDGTANRLQAALLEGMEEGETIPQLKNRIMDIDEEWLEAGRAEMIARTETARAYSSGTTNAWKETNVVEGKIWNASSDACPYCLAMNGQEKEIDENFFNLGDSMPNPSGKGEMSFDYSDIIGPPLHPSCRCALIAQLSTEKRNRTFIEMKMGTASSGSRSQQR